MAEFPKSVTDVISAAKDNPLALVALLLIIAGWVVITLKVRRNKQLLQSLNQLPEKDRIKALEAEMGHVRIKGGMSAEQWLRHRAQQYVFVAFALLCLLVVMLAAIFWYKRQPNLKTGLAIGLNPAELHAEASASNDAQTANVVSTIKWGVRQMAEDGIPAERTLVYESQRKEGIEHIRYRLPYLDLFRSGAPIVGGNALNATFKWRFPELSIKVVNNTKETMVLSKALITVLSSKVDSYPLLLIDDLSVRDLVIRNEGWCDLSNVVVHLSVDEPRSPNEIPMFVPETNRVDIGFLTTSRRIAITNFLPERLQHAEFVSVSGQVAYDCGKERQSVRFNTRVSLHVMTAVGIPVSHTYRAFFRANEAPLTLSVDVAQQIAPGAADRFLIILGTDKTSQNRIKIDFQTAGGEKLLGDQFSIDLFAPRSASEIASGSGYR